MNQLLAHLQQPSSVVGAAILAGGLAALATGSVDWRILVPAFVSGAVAVAIPDNANARTLIAKATADVIEAASATVVAERGAKVLAPAAQVAQSPLADAASRPGWVDEAKAAFRGARTPAGPPPTA
jgi:uncharacterized membrane protein YjjP (DUF1212 family)